MIHFDPDTRTVAVPGVFGPEEREVRVARKNFDPEPWIDVDGNRMRRSGNRPGGAAFDPRPEYEAECYVAEANMMEWADPEPYRVDDLRFSQWQVKNFPLPNAVFDPRPAFIAWLPGDYSSHFVHPLAGIAAERVLNNAYGEGGGIDKRTIEEFHVTREGGKGCPETDGGAHYFAFIDPSVDYRICIDCAAPEFAAETVLNLAYGPNGTVE